MKRNRHTCRACKRVVARPKMQELTIDSPTPGQTALGRQVPLSAKVGYWQCPKCGEANVESLGLLLDPDALLVQAYEKHFGKLDESARAALAKLNADFIRRFGEDWQNQFGGADQVENIITMAVQAFREQCGDDWAEQMVWAEPMEFIDSGENADA